MAAFAVVALWQVSRARCFAIGAPAICRVETAAPVVALTFDDGPTDLGVDSLLPELARHGGRATFFVTGQEVERRPDLARRILAAGHELGDHSFSHVRMVGRPQAFYEAEIARTQAAIRRAGGEATAFRPPYGKKLIGLPRAVRDAGLDMVLWDVEDPQTTDPKVFAEEVVRSARPGSIILLHPMYSTNRTAREALPAILAGLEAKGLRVVPAGELIGEHGSP